MDLLHRAVADEHDVSGEVDDGAVLVVVSPVARGAVSVKHNATPEVADAHDLHNTSKRNTSLVRLHYFPGGVTDNDARIIFHGGGGKSR